MPHSPAGTVLVTGGAGYIGSHAVLALRDAGRAVAVVDTLATGFRWAVPDDVAFYHGDVADGALIDRIVAEQGVTAIMHFAGSLLVPESVTKPLDYYRNNVVASRNLIEAAVRNGVAHFIFSSTAAVYGTPDVVPVAEDARKSPINPYGNSKLMTETMLADVAHAHPLSFGILRYFNVAGADPAARSGQSTRGATHLIHVAAEAARGLRDEVMVYGTDYDTPDGTGVRDYIHVSDLAAAHVAALDWLEAHPGESFIAQLRLFTRFFGPRGARRGRPGDQPDAQAHHRPAPGRRSGDARRRDDPHPRAAHVDAAIRPARNHRRPCARVGTPARPARPPPDLTNAACVRKARAPFVQVLR